MLRQQFADHLVINRAQASRHFFGRNGIAALRPMSTTSVALGARWDVGHVDGVWSILTRADQRGAAGPLPSTSRQVRGARRENKNRRA